MPLFHSQVSSRSSAGREYPEEAEEGQLVEPPKRMSDLRNGSKAIAASMRPGGRTSPATRDQVVPSHSDRSSSNTPLPSWPPNRYVLPVAGQKARAEPVRALGQPFVGNGVRSVKAAVAGFNSQISPSGRFVVAEVKPPTRSRRSCAESVTSEAYMRPVGRLGSLPSRRCVHAPVLGSHSQTSARPLPVSMSHPPTSTVTPRPGSYAMAWP